MDQTERQSNRVKVAIPIRVCGMSTQHKFFDETTQTALLGPRLVITRIQNLVDLETELLVINPKNNVAGTFRVLWLNLQGKEGWHDVGLELVEAEGDLWEIPFPAGEARAAASAAQAWLECQRCHQMLLIPVPEADSLYEGFRIARTCERCKATTPWEFVPAETQEAEPIAAGAAGAARVIKKKPAKEMRTKGRAPLQTDIKVIRERYGTFLADRCKTVNVSRQGAYFLTKENYTLGEEVSVVLHYQEDDVSIPLPAYVVRVGPAKDGFYNAVAIKLEGGKR